MANFDLEVHIVHRSKYNAEIEFVERHNDDIPMYITSRLMASQDGTCVTFELDHYASEGRPNPLLSSQTRRSMTTALSMSILWVAVSLVLFTPSANMSAMLCLTPVVFLVMFIRENSTIRLKPATYKINTDKVRRLIRQRADILKGDLYATLHIDPAEAHRDELGNEYYIDMSDQERKSSSEL